MLNGELPDLVESWRTVWRQGFGPLLSTTGLSALRVALERDDPRLAQGLTTTPPPLKCVEDAEPCAACALGFVGWQDSANPLQTVGQVEEFFARACYDADQALQEPAACRWFLNWFDDTPRNEMRRELMAEIDLILEAREQLERGEVGGNG